MSIRPTNGVPTGPEAEPGSWPAWADVAPAQLLRAVLLVTLLVLTLYLVLVDHGEISGVGNLLHEVMHDGRHLLGAPCD